MIPKVIHYCWFGGKPLPLDVEQCIRSWKKFCPDYEIRQWNESNYDVGKHPFMKAAYETGSWAFVSDYARLDIIYNHGGVYLDTDVELLKDLQPLLELDCYFGMQQDRNLIATGLGFGAVKGHGIAIVLGLAGEYGRRKLRDICVFIIKLFCHFKISVKENSDHGYSSPIGRSQIS
jgi:hypothetical protein